MKVRVPDYFKDFRCIASQCEDTCCAGWEIVIDEESYEYYQNLDGDFGRTLRKNIKSENGENTFVLKGNRCSFLSESNTCDIYSNIGKDKLCYTCQQYPRYMEEFLDLRERGLSLSCPEAARIILKENKKSAFYIEEFKSEPKDEEDDYVDREILREFSECRDILIDIMDKENLSLESKCNSALDFVRKIQNKIDLGDMDEIKTLISEYKKAKVIDESLKALDEYKKDNDEIYKEIFEYLRIFKGLKQINTKDSLGLNKALVFLNKNKETYVERRKKFSIYYKENMYEFKNLLIYFIFRYFMKGIYDYDLSAKIKIAVISMLIIKELAIIKWLEDGYLEKKDIVRISFNYSKNIEHSDENIEDIQEIFETKEIFEVSNIISLLNSSLL